jgi:tRNA(Ile)-lysidine synthase
MKYKSFPTFAKLLTHREFRHLCKWVDQFMVKYQLYPENGKALISLSGGADSVLLSLVLKQFQNEGKLKELKFVHFHHGTRRGQDEELEFVKSFTQKYKIKGDFIYLNLSESNRPALESIQESLEITKISNFELVAREARLKHILSYEMEHFTIYLGHHLDDSFEWSLMQQFKSSEFKSTLGIPVKNGSKRRPFMCMAKHQIIRMLGEFNMSFVDDPSNLEEKFERNYLRHQIIPQIKLKYPSYLKNYVTRQNKMTRELVNVSGKKWTYEKDFLGGILLSTKDNMHEINRDQIVDCIKQLSSLKRGSLRDQLEKLFTAYQNGKKGPLSFSGGVKIFLDKNKLYFINKNIEQKIKNIDKGLYNYLKDGAQIPVVSIRENDDLISKSNSALLFPFLFFCRDKNARQILGPSMKALSPIFPLSTKYLIENHIWFQRKDRIRKFNNKLTLESLTPRFN